jgi:hypothetical protein
MKRSDLKEAIEAARDFIDRAKYVDSLAEQAGYKPLADFAIASLGREGQQLAKHAKATRTALMVVAEVRP